MDNGTTLKVHGEGGEGPKGGRPGNLMLQIRVSCEAIQGFLFKSISQLFKFCQDVIFECTL